MKNRTTVPDLQTTPVDPAHLDLRQRLRAARITSFQNGLRQQIETEHQQRLPDLRR